MIKVMPELNNVIMQQSCFDELELTTQIKQLCIWIKFDYVKIKLAKTLAERLTILRRDYLDSLNAGDLQEMKQLTDNADPHENRATLDSEMMYMVLGSNKNYDEIAEMIHL